VGINAVFVDGHNWSFCRYEGRSCGGTSDTYVQSIQTNDIFLSKSKLFFLILENITDSNIDAGDFVLDALGERWAGELCQASYLSTGYFSSDSQNSTRWLYYRTRTEGQNTIVYNGSNQVVDARPSSIRFETTGDAHTGPVCLSKQDSAVYWVVNLTTSYGGVLIERGIRLFNGRSQVLLQDEIIEATSACQWRMHTNATIKYKKGGIAAGLSYMLISSVWDLF
jgi:hypothetical protein